MQTNHSPPLSVKIWGDFACFTRPEMKGGAGELRCHDAFRGQGHPGGDILETRHPLEGRSNPRTEANSVHEHQAQ